MMEFRLINGINVDQMMQTIEPVKENPDLASCKFRPQTLGSKALVKMAQKYSPVFNTITKATPVAVHLET
jgi:hypothetical protein